MKTRTRVWCIRLAALAVAIACGGVTWMLAAHRSSQPMLGPYSVPALASLFLAAASTLAATSLFVLPEAIILRCHRWLSEGLARIDQEPIPRGNAVAGTLLGLLALASFATMNYRFMQVNSLPLYDQQDYLRVAEEIRALGPATFIQQLWDGRYHEANRHPLYPAMLAMRPNLEWGKRLSSLFGWITLIAILCAAWRRFGAITGGIAAILLATNNVFHQSASLVACESLLMLLCLLAWSVIEHTVAREESLSAHSQSRAVQSILLGTILGLGYLTKASAFFLLIGFFAWSLTVSGLRRWSWLSLVAFLAVSSPLVVRNVRAFGDPLYSMNNRFVFADSFEEGLAREHHGSWSSAREYWQTHSASEVLGRLVGGVAWEGFVLLRALGPATGSHSAVLAGFVILLLAICGTMVRSRRFMSAAASWFVPFMLFFGWYGVIARGDRFLVPLMPMLLMESARGAVMLVRGGAAIGDDKLARRVLATAVLWCLAIIAVSWRSAPKSAPMPPSVIGDRVAVDLCPPRGRALRKRMSALAQSRHAVGTAVFKVDFFHLSLELRRRTQPFFDCEALDRLHRECQFANRLFQSTRVDRPAAPAKRHRFRAGLRRLLMQLFNPRMLIDVKNPIQ